MFPSMEHKIKKTLKFLSQHKTCNNEKRLQTLNSKKLKQEAKAKNLPLKLSKKKKKKQKKTYLLLLFLILVNNENLSSC
jgi:hypothetical protein